MNFVVYSKVGCPYCDKVKIILEQLGQSKNFSVVSYELDKDFTREEFYSEFGVGSTFPQVICNEKHIGGCTDTIKYLQENKIV
jgi:glutaredoxin